ncbi:hypothetical protein FPV67DRAFT_1669081 [Lyophyllum atratum]|nr:hypothetical protein FPV67DRAFT_1669081 [Lyophyllum atratum]
MAGVISSVRNLFPWGTPEKLQTAQENADEAIQKLRGHGDPEVTAILVARFEELKKRHERLAQYQACLPRNMPEEPELNEISPEEEETSSIFRCKMVTQEDGTLKYILVPGFNSDDPTGVSSEFTKRLAPYDENHNVESIMAAAGQVITNTMETIDKHAPTLRDFQLQYLSDMSDRLAIDEQKIELLRTCMSSTATKVAAHLYLSDALRFLQAILSMVHPQEHREDPHANGGEKVGKEGSS